jgi:N6-adenosine-specific RNA methylase IME4
MDLRAINEIIVGDRHRKQAGDIAALAQNIDEIGLLHPVVIDPAGHLIAGARRLMAFQHLGCTTIPRTTNHHMREAFGVLDAWGFEQKTILTWAKDKMGMGDWLRGKTEHCLLAVRGKPVVELKNQTTLLHGAVREHSQKPVEFYDYVEELCPAPRYGYLFSRYQHNESWDCHGDEAPSNDP